MNSRLTTFGRRVVITSAVFGLTTVGSAGVALAADTVGFSPSGKVVARAPMAVSVTFKEPLRGGGARMRILTTEGDVGTGAVTTSRKTLRRSLRVGAPQGDYRVEWKAVTVKGRKLSGTFTFFAASGNEEVERKSPVPSPPTTPPPTPTPSTSEWISGSEPMWTPQPSATSTSDAMASGKSGGSGGDRGVSNGFTVVPLTVGGLLVLAAGVVSLVNRPRLRG